jgi:hypothetical protein
MPRNPSPQLAPESRPSTGEQTFSASPRVPEPRPDLGEQLGCLVGQWLANQADLSSTRATPRKPRPS